ncbi:MAG: hypothetical protein WDZ41_04880 [Candidatus Babeliales bacterium]
MKVSRLLMFVLAVSLFAYYEIQGLYIQQAPIKQAGAESIITNKTPQKLTVSIEYQTYGPDDCLITKNNDYSLQSGERLSANLQPIRLRGGYILRKSIKIYCDTAKKNLATQKGNLLSGKNYDIIDDVRGFPQIQLGR